MAQPSLAEVTMQALTRASSQDPAVMKPAEATLQSMETQPGFYAVLLEISCRQEVPLQPRMLAVMFFKNRIDRFWRNRDNSITDAEKAHIKAHLLKALQEPNGLLAAQQAVLIGKIARKDVPHDWPALVPQLAEAVSSGSQLQQQRALLILYRVMKALASKRL
eukprot:gene21458-22454_t